MRGVGVEWREWSGRGRVGECGVVWYDMVARKLRHSPGT